MEFLSAFTLPNEQGQAMDLVGDDFLKVPPPKVLSVQVSVAVHRSPMPEPAAVPPPPPLWELW